MCLIAMAWGVSPEYPLVIASNRDEFYTRPTAALAHWRSPAGQIIASGRDLQSGGTWMGFTPHGRFAMLTNVRNPQTSVPAGTPSRGDLVVSWLESALDANAWSAQFNFAQYAGFNLIVGDWQAQQCHYLSNQHPSIATGLPAPAELAEGTFRQQNRPLAQQNVAQAATKSIVNILPQTIPSGQVLGLSNAALNTPWPKTTQLVGQLQQALQTPQNLPQLQTQLQAVLQNDQPAHDALLPHTGVPLAQEKALSSVYVRYPREAPVYGTRSSLCAVLSRDHHLHLSETTHPGRAHAHLRLNWPVPSKAL